MTKSILFNTDMVRAILDNRKTVTRRVVKLKYSNTHLEMFTNKYGTRLIEKQNEKPGITTIKNPDGTTTHTLLACIEKTPPYRPGDILYVRETWYENGDYWLYPFETERFRYKADSHDMRLSATERFFRWHPSIHMPREAARIFLRVTDVRVERLQDIDDDGVVAEGLEIGSPFDELWDSTIKKADRALYGWNANPWVFVISFERISKDETLQ